MNSPELQERQDKFTAWCETIRDPARASTEGPRRLTAGNAKAEYQIAPLPDGRFAITCHFSATDSGMGTPWTLGKSREECVDYFLAMGRTFFEGREQMIRLLSADSLFGFIEPDVDKASADKDANVDAIIQSHLHPVS
ncbi:MAG: hypothetical protein JWP89_2587 [Schlesneria sp.]|nr:hypothetical protein [Schlesneria sp.]